MLALSLAGCDANSADDVRVDSATPLFELSDQPSLVLADDGTEEKLFSRVTARRLPEGEILVAEPSAATVQLFGRNGRLIRTLARRGDGPGELSGGFVIAAER